MHASARSVHPAGLRILSLLCLLAIGACGSSKSDADKASATTPKDEATLSYHDDVRRICNAEELSGALAEEENRRSMVVAMWLGSNLVTQQARDLLAKQAPLPPAEKRALLLGEARAAGLDACKTAEAWQ
jgi:hypothetical protein